MSSKVAATLYYDIISPFAYLYIKQRHRLGSLLDIKPVPILLGGLLRSTDNKGPGEVAAKRPHTYQFCVWQAEKLGIPFFELDKRFSCAKKDIPIILKRHMCS